MIAVGFLMCRFKNSHIASLFLACMWFFYCDLSLAWRIAWIDSGFPRLSISWITMVIVGLISLFIFVGSHGSLAWVELLVPRISCWKNSMEAL